MRQIVKYENTASCGLALLLETTVTTSSDASTHTETGRKQIESSSLLQPGSLSLIPLLVEPERESAGKAKHGIRRAQARNKSAVKKGRLSFMTIE